MCVEVRRTTTSVPRWNRRDVAIDIPFSLTSGEVLLLVRQILTELGTPQTTMGATCFCGEPVAVQGLLPYARQRALHAPMEMVEVVRGA